MTTTLTCKQCGFENEGERVYCHNCGTKLDRSVLPPETGREASAAEVRKRVKNIGRPPSFTTGSLIKKILGLIFWAALTASTIEMIRTPNDVPPMPESKLIDAPAIGLALEDAINDPNGRTLVFDEAGINGYLLNTLRPKGSGDDLVLYQRTFVKIKPGTLWITTQRAIWGYPIYASKAVALGIQQDGLVATTKGGAVGRLPIHPALMEYFDMPFANVWEMLSRERKLVNKLQSITVGPEHVVMRTGPGAAR